MQFAVNYSPAAADLLREGQIQIDYFKCPAWPEVVTAAQGIHPTYVHFPLKVGLGINDAMDSETNRPADWEKVEALMAQTGTPMVNLHLIQTTDDCPDIPFDTTDPGHIEMLTGRMIQDVSAVVKRFGPERVIVENVPYGRDRYLPPGYLPESIGRVVEETNCGFLFDVSHARLAAHHLGMNAREYIEALPTEHTREIHITGIQRFEGRWVELARRVGIDEDTIGHLEGQLIDHLPMTGEDWEFFAWAMEQVHSGAWGKPWVVTFEYGGVGPLFAAATEKDVLAEQIPCLYALVNGKHAGITHYPVPSKPINT